MRVYLATFVKKDERTTGIVRGANDLIEAIQLAFTKYPQYKPNELIAAHEIIEARDEEDSDTSQAEYLVRM